MIKKQNKKTVIRGKIYITSTFNNTLVTIADDRGNPIVVGSTGMHGFSGTRKSTPYAATVTIENAIKKAEERFDFQVADVLVKGIGPGREAALRAIKASRIDVNRIIDITPVPHNGVRPPKIRRV